MLGLVGKKIGMTRIFTEEGISIPVTVIEITENKITQIKNFKIDKYNAIQVTTGIVKTNKLKKSILGHYKKSKVVPGRGLWEFRINNNSNNYFLGDIINLDILKEVKVVDITGTSKGKGFSGTIKRWNFRSQDSSHGNSLSHRVPGSIGQNQTPGKVFKGKKMSGQLGNCQITVQNIKVIRIDLVHHLLLVKGSVPGYSGNNLIVKPSIKIKGV
ncbi:50S ribosomal protein L3 [Buchnera aphidicola (Tetraneura ulmi)]|uniref:50S ribosomal protein L3 n=1 Tax=Buchnera aphidicola TaxID=9 RepID=UPI0034645008